MRAESNQLLRFSIIGFGLLPIMPNALTGLLPVLLFFSALIFHLKNPTRSLNLKTLIINSSLFLIYLVSLLYTNDLGYGFRKLGPAAWIPVFAIVFYWFLDQHRISANTVNSMFRLMVISTASYLTIFLIYAFVIQTWVPSAEESMANQLRGILLEIPLIDRHPIYLSLFIGISILYLIHKLVSSKDRTTAQKTGLSACLALFTLFLFLIQSKGALIYLALSAPVIMAFRAKSRKGLLALISIAFLASGIVVITNSASNNRFKELFDPATYSDQRINPYNSSQIRIAIWQVSAEAITGSPVWGYGLGDVQKVLDDLYLERSPVLLAEQYNSHNQYLGIWLIAGIPGLVVFLFFLYHNWRSLYRSSLLNGSLPLLGLAILLFFMLNFLTENVIERQLGSMTFFFLLNLLGSAVKTQAAADENTGQNVFEQSLRDKTEM